MKYSVKLQIDPVEGPGVGLQLQGEASLLAPDIMSLVTLLFGTEPVEQPAADNPDGIDISHPRAKRCENPACQRWYIGRSDQRVCGREACIEWRKGQAPKTKRPRTVVPFVDPTPEEAMSTHVEDDQQPDPWKPTVTVEAGNGVTKGSAIVEPEDGPDPRWPGEAASSARATGSRRLRSMPTTPIGSPAGSSTTASGGAMANRPSVLASRSWLRRARSSPSRARRSACSASSKARMTRNASSRWNV